MPNTDLIVINTGPIIAIVAALGELDILSRLYSTVIVPYEVCEEIMTTGSVRFAQHEFNKARFLSRCSIPAQITSYLSNTLDRGEAAVIQTALDQGVKTVCIDETAGRRVARLYDLSVTGSIGILIRAKTAGYSFSMKIAIQNMTKKGVWLSASVKNFALKRAGE